MIDIAETDFRIATLLPQIFSTQTQGDISALLKITEQRIVHRSTIKYTIASSPPRIVVHLGPSWLQRQSSQKFGIAPCWSFYTFVAHGRRNFAKGGSIPRIGGGRSVPIPTTKHQAPKRHRKGWTRK